MVLGFLIIPLLILMVIGTSIGTILFIALLFTGRERHELPWKSWGLDSTKDDHKRKS